MVSRGLVGLVASVAFFVSGCSSTSAPTQIGLYRLDEDAGKAVGVYGGKVMRDVYGVAEDMLPLFDTDGDKVISYGEMEEMIAFMRPYTTKAHDDLVAAVKEKAAKAVAKKQNPEKEDIVKK